MLLNKIKDGLQRSGKSKGGLAEAMNIHQSQVSRLLKGERAIKADEIPLIERYLEISLSGGPVPSAPIAPRQPEFTLVDAPRPDRDKMPLDVPVYGTAVGGIAENFMFDSGIIDYVRRPPGIANAKDVFALRVRGESMSPRYEEGDLIYLNPHAPPKSGDDVVIEFHPAEEGEHGGGTLKRFVRRAGSEVIVRQFNPEDELKFDARTIKRICRVLTMSELMGI